MTPLTVATTNSTCESLQLCRVFLESGARVDGAGTWNQDVSPLWNAAQIRRNYDIVSLLPEYGENVSWKVHESQLTYYAIAYDDIHVVKLLLDSGVDLNAYEEESCPLLFLTRDPRTVKLLLEHGADVNHVCNGNSDYDGMTPLMGAVDEASLELVQVLLDAGADVNKRGEHEKSNFALIRAIKRRDPAIVQLLIEAGCDMQNQVDEKGTPALHLAVQSDNEKIIGMLLEAGVDIKATYKSRTPLLEAIECCEPGIVQMLLDADPGLSYADRSDLWPVLFATAGSQEALHHVACYGWEVFAQSCWCDETSPLFWTPHKVWTNILIVKMLLAHSANISQASYRGLGILHFAAWRNNKMLIGMLLDAGADPLYEDADGETPGGWASLLDDDGDDAKNILLEAEEARRNEKNHE